MLIKDWLRPNKSANPTFHLVNFCWSKGKNLAYASNAVYHHFDWREEASDMEHLWNISRMCQPKSAAESCVPFVMCSIFLESEKTKYIQILYIYVESWKINTSSFKFTKNRLLLASWSLGSVCVFHVSFPNALLFALFCLLFPQCKGGYIASFGSSARRIFRSTDERQDLQHLSVITLWWHGIVKYYLSKRKQNA